MVPHNELRALTFLLPSKIHYDTLPFTVWTHTHIRVYMYAVQLIELCRKWSIHECWICDKWNDGIRARVRDVHIIWVHELDIRLDSKCELHSQIQWWDSMFCSCIINSVSNMCMMEFPNYWHPIFRSQSKCSTWNWNGNHYSKYTPYVKVLKVYFGMCANVVL